MLDAAFNVHAEVLPQLALLEPVAHVIAGLDQKLLALVAFGLGQVRIILAERQAAKGDVARLVLHDIGIDRGSERRGRMVADTSKGGKRQTLDHHLHAKIGHIPAPVVQHLLEQGAQRRGDRIDGADLLQQPLVCLDMPRLVDGLG